jgi:hypothetical protein
MSFIRQQQTVDAYVDDIVGLQGFDESVQGVVLVPVPVALKT